MNDNVKQFKGMEETVRRLMEASVSQKSIRVYRRGPIETQADVDFLEKAFQILLTWVASNESKESGNFKIGDAEFKRDNFKLVLADIPDILFKSKSFSIRETNEKIGWVREVKNGNSKYQSSKPTVNNMSWLPKVESFKKALEWICHQIGTKDTEKNLTMVWATVFRTPTAEGLMGPIIGQVLAESEGPRDIVFSHGFASAAPWEIVNCTYLACNLVILHAMKVAKDMGLVVNFKEPVLVSGKSSADVKNAFVNTASSYVADKGLYSLILAQKDVNKKIPSWETLVRWGMVVPAGKLKENSVFANPLTLDLRGTRENELFRVVNDIVATYNHIAGTKYKSDYDWNTFQPMMKQPGDNPIRVMEKSMKDFKAAIVYSVERRPGNVTKISPAYSVNVGEKSLTGKALF